MAESSATSLPLSKLVYELLMAAGWTQSRWRIELELSAYELQAVLQVLQRSMTVGELGHRLSLSSGAMTALVDRLVERELLERVPHPRDRRKVVLQPTAMATQRVWNLVAPISRSIDDVASTLSPEHSRLVSNIVEQVIRVYKDEAQR
jgi:DNA-binding MarR family transcriptional regulator